MVRVGVNALDGARTFGTTKAWPGPGAARSQGRRAPCEGHLVNATMKALFINSPLQPGADTVIQALLMRHLDRARVELHAASTPGTVTAPSPTFDLLSAIPDV